MKTQQFAIGTTVTAFITLALFTLLLSLPSTVSASTVRDKANRVATSSVQLENKLKSGRASTTVDISCMASAIEIRETALTAAWTNLSESVSEALGARTTALVAAWNISSVSDRTAALKTAWKEWKDDKKAAHTEFRNDRKAAWETFKKTAKDSCKTSIPKDETLEKTEKDSIAI
jgi:hypothetical protein